MQVPDKSPEEFRNFLKFLTNVRLTVVNEELERLSSLHKMLLMRSEISEKEKHSIDMNFSQCEVPIITVQLLERERDALEVWKPGMSADQALSSQPSRNTDPVKQSSLLTVSIPSLPIKKGERVVGFTFHFNSARVAALPNVPMGWNVTVDNDPSWNTAIEGSIGVGAAALEPSFLRDFLRIEKDESLGIPFNVQGEIVVSEDFEHERHLKVGKKELNLIATSIR